MTSECFSQDELTRLNILAEQRVRGAASRAYAELVVTLEREKALADSYETGGLLPNERAATHCLLRGFGETVLGAVVMLKSPELGALITGGGIIDIGFALHLDGKASSVKLALNARNRANYIAGLLPNHVGQPQEGVSL